MPGSTRSRPILAVLSTPQITFFMAFLPMCRARAGAPSSQGAECNRYPRARPARRAPQALAGLVHECARRCSAARSALCAAAQRRLDQRQRDEVALRVAAAEAVRDVAHRLDRGDRVGVAALRRTPRCPARAAGRRRGSSSRWCRVRAARRASSRQQRCASRPSRPVGDERQHRVHVVERVEAAVARAGAPPTRRRRARSGADVDAFQRQPPQQRRRVDQRQRELRGPGMDAGVVQRQRAVVVGRGPGGTAPGATSCGTRTRCPAPSRRARDSSQATPSSMRPCISITCVTACTAQPSRGSSSQRAARGGLGLGVLVHLLEPERVHAEHVGVARAPTRPSAAARATRGCAGCSASPR